MSERDREFGEFAAGRSARLQSFAYLCCGDWHRAEDAVQRALLKLYLAWHRVEPGGHDGYVRRIIVNTLIDDGRLSWFRRVGLTAEPPETPPLIPKGPEDRLVLTDALMELPPRQRAAVLLRFWDDLSLDDTARVMGCTSGAAKKLAARGLAALRSRLGDFEYEGAKL